MGDGYIGDLSYGRMGDRIVHLENMRQTLNIVIPAKAGIQ
jgi:hypothetical protein